MLSGNPAGFFLAASGAMGFGKGTEWQMASMMMGFAGTAILVSQTYSSPALAESTNGAQGTDGTNCTNCLDPTARPEGLPKAEAMPLEGRFRVTTEHGGHTAFTRFHRRIDLASVGGSFAGQEVFATDSGTITDIGKFRSGATFVQLTTNNGLIAQYVHTQLITGIQVGVSVSPGQAIGAINLSGNVTGPHLHFQINFQGNWVNPRFYLGIPK